MNKLYFLSVFVLSLIIASCNKSHQTTPEDTTNYFLEKLRAVEFDRAAECTVGEVKTLVLDLHTEWKMSNEKEKELIKSSFQFPVQDLKCDTVDNIVLCTIVSPKDNQLMTFAFEKQDKYWYINYWDIQVNE